MRLLASWLFLDGFDGRYRIQPHQLDGKPTSLFVSIPKKVIVDWGILAGQIVEFSTLVEGQDVFLKVRKITV